MKKTLPLVLCLALVALAGCSTANKKTESLHSVETFYETGKLASREVLRDRSKGGGTAVLADPKASQINSEFINQSKLGGGSKLKVGEISSTVSTNGIKSVGDAGGQFLNSTVTGGN